MAEQRIKGPVTLLSPPLINQSGGGIVLSQPLGAAHVRMQGEGGVWAVEEEPASPASRCLQWTAAALAPLTPRRGGQTAGPISPNGLLFYSTSAVPITIPEILDPP